MGLDGSPVVSAADTLPADSGRCQSLFPINLLSQNNRDETDFKLREILHIVSSLPCLTFYQISFFISWVLC